MLSKHIYRSGLRALRRHISTGEPAVTQPLHFLNGKRVNLTNPDATHDFAVLEPATGMYRNIETFPSFFLALTMTVLVDGEQETEPELNLPGKIQKTNNTSNPCLGVFSFFPG